MNSSMSDSKPRPWKYAAGLVSLLLFLFLFDRGLYLLLYHLETKFNERTNFEETFSRYMEDKSYSTLILGTSRAYEGIHPKYFTEHLGENAYKETYRGKGPKYCYYFYKLYKKYAGIPKVVVYGVDYFVYNITSYDKWMAHFKTGEPPRPAGLFSSPLLLLARKGKLDTFQNEVLLDINEIGEERGKQKNRDPFIEFNRIQEYTGTEAPLKNIVVKKPVKYLRQAYIHPPGIEGDYFIKLLEELDNDNVTIVLVGLPDFFGSYKTNYQRDIFIKDLKILKRRFKKLEVINYNRQYRFNLDNTAYFNDGGYGHTNSHLSQTGAAVFNKLLCEDLKQFYR